MKKLIFVLTMLTLSTGAFAGSPGGHGSYHHGGHRGGFGGWGWVAPVVITGAVIYGVTRPAPVYVPPQPIYTEYIEYDTNCQCNIRVLRQTGWR